MSQNSTIRKFIDRNVERLLVREFLLSKTEKCRIWWFGLPAYT